MTARTLPPLVGAALAVVSCGGDATAPPGPRPVATVIVAPDSSSLPRGGTLQLAATLRAADGSDLSGRTVVWSTSDPARARVSTGGLVTAVDAGRAVITATSEGRSGSAVVVVEEGTFDLAVVDAHFTQVVQTAPGSIPMVLDGNAAVVNVLVRSDAETTTAMPIVLRIVDAATQALVHADTVPTAGRLVPNPGYDRPSAQLLVPPAVLRPGLAWQVIRDPDGTVPDDSAANDAYPRSGYAPLTTVDVPTLTVRFVPIVLAAHGNATGAVSDATVPDYLSTLRRIHPIGRIDAHVGPSFSSNESFGTPPRGGERDFWVRVLSELDLARIADPVEPHAHWYGVVRPPPGFNFTEFGGFAYIPSSGTSIGANTRTALGVQVGWFNREGQAEDLVAHELGHNFGRRHAPCGGAGAPLDPAYPVPGGTLDHPGHDVYSWMTGATSSARVVSTTTGDVMGYCFPMWSSAYTYDAILGFRSVSALAAAPVSSVLVVRGHIADGAIELEPAFTLAGRPSPPEDGAYQLDGLADDGTLLFEHTFRPASLDHAPDVRSFTLAVPVTSQLESDLHTLRVRGPEAEARLARPPLADRSRAAAPREPTLVRTASGMTHVACPAGARGVLVHSAAGAVLGTARGTAAVVAVEAGSPVVIACSDGVRTHRYPAIVP